MDSDSARRRFYDDMWPHMPVVLRTAHLLCGRSSADAEDLAQETMLKAFRSIEQFQPGSDARAWLMTILRHTRIDRLRSARSSSGIVSLEDLAQEPVGRPEIPELDRQAMVENPETLLDDFKDAEMVEGLGRLPEEIRWTLLLVDVEGMDHKEAAQVLGVPVGTIKSRAHRGRTMLRDELLPLARQARIVRD